MKKIFNAFFVILISILMFNNIYALEASDITSNEALLVDMNNDKVLFSKNTNDDKVPIASLTKIMTYVVTVENISDLSNTNVTIPDGLRQSILDQDASNAKLQDGYSYSILDLLYGLMLPSGCDAAEAIALYISNNNYDAFVKLMNDKAKELGMNNTIFYNASGLESDGKYNLSTEQDLYLLAKYAYNLPHFKEIIKTEFYTLTGYKGEIVHNPEVRNTNYMMGEFNGAEYYYQYSQGGKTGNLSVAGKCLISYAKKGDLELLAITLGVPYNQSDYNLTDHKKLFEYGFAEFSDNITVTIDTKYKSVDIGKKIQIEPTTSSETSITWTSSDESVATVNEYGVVTGKGLGMAKIIATTQTGNQDYTYVSVGFYNGVDVRSISGPIDPNSETGYGELDFSILKKYGIDFAVIRAGYNLKTDPSFVTNIKNAINNNINILISYDGYATTEETAIVEANFLLELLNNISEYLDKIKLPIVYNLYPSPLSDPTAIETVTNAFSNVLKEKGFETAMELSKGGLTRLNLKSLKDNNIGLYFVYRPNLPDFKTRMSTVVNNETINADMWYYRGDAYFGKEGIGNAIIMSTLYMDYKNMNTMHEEFNEDLYPEYPTLSIDETYTYTGEEQTVNITGFDSKGVDIVNNKNTNAGTYEITVKPKTKWKDGSKREISIVWQILPADPELEELNLTGYNKKKLSTVKLPKNWSWKNKNEIIDKSKTNKYVAIYTPEDLSNYNTVEKELTINIKEKETTNTDSNDEYEEYTEYNNNENNLTITDNNNKVKENKTVIDNKKEETNNEEESSSNTLLIIVICGIICVIFIAFRKKIFTED